MTRVALSSPRCRATAFVEAEVDVSISDVDSEDLVQELETRGDLTSKLPKTLEAFPHGTMAEILDLLEMKKADEALILVRAILFPKWKTKDDCESQFKLIRNQQ